MRRLLFLAVLMLGCSRAPDELGSSARDLSAPLRARLTGLHAIVRGGALEPRLSPDGQWVGFSGHRYQGLRVASASGGEVLSLTDEPAAGLHFAWSPDASRLAFVTREEDNSSFLKVVARTGGASRTLFHAGPEQPYPFAQFTEAGELVYLAGDRLRAADRDLALTSQLPSPRLATLTRTGELFVAGDRGIFFARADGSELTAAFEGKSFFELAASPDASIVLARELRPDGPGLWSLDRKTGARVLLEGFDRGCMLPSGLVVAERLEGDGLRWTRGELYAMRADGSGATRLEGAPGAIHYRVDCAQKMERIAVGDAASDSVFVADVEVSR
jgi:hypothetical protein